MSASTWSTARVPVEPILWTILSVCALAVYPTWASVSVLCGCAVSWITRKSQSHQSSEWRQHPSSTQYCDDSQGTFMGIALLPLLVQAMGALNDRWTLYSKLLSLTWLHGTTPLPILAIAVGLTIILDSELQDIKVGVFLLMSWLVLTIVPKVCFTIGEWVLVSGITAITLTEWIALLKEGHDDVNHVDVALSGVVGCLASTAFSVAMKNNRSLWERVAVLVVVPLVAVECLLCTRSTLPFPRAPRWLINFLIDSESSGPRGVWLIYWALMLLGSFLLAPTPSISVVVARKWFHLIAVLLFAPVTVLAPQLMSLSYAIAFCILMAMESVRSELPAAVQDFYAAYLDHDKDDGGIVVSHMALIVGCAMPLWIYEAALPTMQSFSLLPLFGILVLGVGDSLGALVGTHFGRTKWAGRRRTLEGSAAMWVGMALICQVLCPTEHWVAAVTFTTLLEAFTTQIDNLVLPLAGATILLMTVAT